MDVITVGYMYDIFVDKNVRIKEIGLPSHNIAFNYYNNKINIKPFNLNKYGSYDVRNFESINLSSSLINKILQIYELQYHTDKLTVDIYKNLPYNIVNSNDNTNNNICIGNDDVEELLCKL